MSAIEWTDETWNPTTGCDRISAGCDSCYALTMARRLKAMGDPKYQRDGDPRTSGPGFGISVHPDTLDLPLRWRKPRRVFVNSMSDLWHDQVPDEFIAKVFATMVAAPMHTFQVLTKRHGRMSSLLRSRTFWSAVSVELGRLWHCDPPAPLGQVPGWIWVGVSVESQQWADIRLPKLAAVPAAVRFASCEPLLGPLDLSPWLGDGLQWVIAGGESGPGARPLHPSWVRSLRDQCEAAGVAYFMKQWGVHTPYIPVVDDPSRLDGKAPDWSRRSVWVNAETGRTVQREADVPPTGSWQAMYRVGKKAAGRVLDGRTHDAFPEVVHA